MHTAQNKQVKLHFLLTVHVLDKEGVKSSFHCSIHDIFFFIRSWYSYTFFKFLLIKYAFIWHPYQLIGVCAIRICNIPVLNQISNGMQWVIFVWHQFKYCFMPVKPHINCLVLTTHFLMCTYDGMSSRVGNNVSIYKLDFDSSWHTADKVLFILGAYSCPFFLQLSASPND